MAFNQRGLAPLILVAIVLAALVLGVLLVQTRTNILPQAQESTKPQTAFLLTRKDSNFPMTYGDPQEGSNNVYNGNLIEPGSEFAVDVRVSSDIDTANTFYALIGFPGDLLEVVEVIKESPRIGDPVFKHPKLQSVLVQLIEAKTSGNGKFEQLIKDYGLSYKDREGKVLVTLRVSPKFNPKTTDLRQYGFEQTNSYETLIEGYAEVDYLYKLAEVEDIEYIEAVMKPSLNEYMDLSYLDTVETGNVTESNGTQAVGRGCKVGGCSGQVCQNDSDETAYTTCEWKDEYVCYQNARCEKQANNQCGWTQTDRLKYCLKNPPEPENCPMTNVWCPNGTEIIGRNENGCPIERCRPVPPSCKPRPACLDSEPRCLIPETDDMCPPGPRPSNSPGCQTDSDCDEGLTCQPNPMMCEPNDPNSICNAAKICLPNPNLTKDYFIQFWLPDTGFSNENGKIFLSGGTAQGLKTSPGQQPVMATIIFRAKKAGSAGLFLTDDSVILRAADAKNILTVKEGLRIQIGKTELIGDLNGDGKVGYGDISILLSKWGSNDEQADLNKNGTVDLPDLSIILKNWSEK